ncbi:hypothetical protein [Actinopolymorpha alba]|uniref:YqeB family protein n=1 Tax=Actinopolymorpha alba TaxID=533267 RepID=UPI000376AC2B|nr:hypothetical protein [Actinopolymorpha alba]
MTSDEPLRSEHPARSDDRLRSTESVRSTEPVRSAESARSTESVRSAESARSTESVRSAESARSPEPASAETVVGQPALERALVWGGFPLLGAGLGWFLRSIAEWAASFQWIPRRGPIELIASLPEGPAAFGGLGLGIVAGLVVAYIARLEYATVSVDDAAVTITRGQSTQTARRSDVGVVFVDDKHLVLLGHATEELARQGGDMPDASRLAEAFRAHGYPWRADGDPYKNDYQRWVEDTPGLPAGAEALFRARARALEKGDKDDIAQLRTELIRLGLVVRDDKKRQFWRRTRPAVPPEA